MKKKELLIIIPVFNEEESIEKFLSLLFSSDVVNIADILVINDASTDATLNIVKRMDLSVISHPYNLGYGMALQTGYKYAVSNKYRYLIQMDSDGQYDLHDILNIYNCLRSGESPDLVIGSRFLIENQSFPISLKKRLAIYFFRKAIQLAGKQEISDPTSGLQGLTYPVFSYYAQIGNFDNDCPDANMLVQMALLGYRIQEIPVVWHQRKEGKSTCVGMIDAILSMCVMFFRICNVFVRGKKSMLAKPIFNKGGTYFEEK